MDQLNRFSRTQAGRKRRPGLDSMLPIGDLSRNPVEFSVEDGDETLSISAARGPSGKVVMTCDCAASIEEGWCKHRVDLLCLRYDRVRDADAATRRAFEQIVTGTTLADAGREADRTLTAFSEGLKAFDERRPRTIVGPDLGVFTDLVSDLAACASELEDSLGTLRRLLEKT